MKPRLLPLLLVLLVLPASALALTPFDITDPAPRTVVVYVDENFDNPSLVGTHLVHAFDGTWSVSAGVGTVTVDAADTISAFQLSGAPGLPALTSSWSDFEVDIQIATRQISDLRQTGYVTIDPTSDALRDRPFTMHLNTTHTTWISGAYTSSCYEIIDFGAPFIFPAWYQNPPQTCGGKTAGPAPFPYAPASGRFNAIGPILVDILSGIRVYGTYGDVQLFEGDVSDVPFGATAAVILAVLLGAATIASASRSESA